MPSRRAARTAAAMMTSTATSDRAMLDARRPGRDRDVGVVALVDAEERDAEREHECLGRARRSAERRPRRLLYCSFRWPRGTSGVGPSRLPRSTVERRPASSGHSLRFAFSGRISSVFSRSRSLPPASSSCCSTRRSRRRSSSTGFRYAATEDWGRLRGLFRVGIAIKWGGGALATLVILALVPVRRRAVRPAGADGAAGRRRVHPDRAGARGDRRRLDDRRRPVRPPGACSAGSRWCCGSSVSRSGSSTASPGPSSGSSSGQIVGSCASGYAGHRLFAQHPAAAADGPPPRSRGD